MTSQPPRPRIAIVGSGISGLAAAWLLGDTFEVTMFERGAALGLGAQGQMVASDNASVRVDIPPRVFNAGHYRDMVALLEEVGMPTYEISQRPVFTDQYGQPYLGFHTMGSGARTRNLPRLHPRTWWWLARHGGELYRWQRFVQRFDPRQIDAGETLAAALDRLGFSPRFRDSFLYPMWVLMCTCRYDQLDAFPARPVLELARNFAGNFATLRLLGGTAALEQRLKQRVHATALGRDVCQIEQHRDLVYLRTAQDPEPVAFSQVILATDPRNAGHLLRDGPWEADRALIAKVPLHETAMTLHTDTTLLSTSLRSPVNLHYDAARRRSSATLWMNPIEHERPTETLLQSWDPMTAPAAGAVKAQRTFHRALMNQASQTAMASLRASMVNDPDRRVWYVGSHVADGVPLLENGVRSAHLVAKLVRERYRNADVGPAHRPGSRHHQAFAM